MDNRFAIIMTVEHDKKHILIYQALDYSTQNPDCLIVTVSKGFVRPPPCHVLSVLFLVSERGSQMFMVM